MLIIAGLGNPGNKYFGNRHNLGFMAINALHSTYNFSSWKKKFHAEIAEGKLDGKQTLLLKPQTFINLSGKSLKETLLFYKLPISDCLVIHDDLNLPVGKVRLKTGGRHGGHNGLKSIDAYCGKDYKRLRLGIGHPGIKEQVVQYVLSDFSQEEKAYLDPLLENIAMHFPLLVQNEDSLFLNKLPIHAPLSKR